MQAHKGAGAQPRIELEFSAAEMPVTVVFKTSQLAVKQRGWRYVGFAQIVDDIGDFFVKQAQVKIQVGVGGTEQVGHFKALEFFLLKVRI